MHCSPQPRPILCVRLIEHVLSRQEFFLTSKLWPGDAGDVRSAYKQSCAALGTDYLDLYLIHWPDVDVHPQGKPPSVHPSSCPCLLVTPLPC